MLPIPRSQLVYFPLVATAGGETQFPPIQNLIGPDVEVVGFTSYSNNDLASTPDLANVVTAADAVNLTVRFAKGTDILFLDIPYTDLNRTLNQGLWYECEPFAIDLTKCIVKTNAAITGPVNAAIMFFYRLKSDR